MFGSITISSIKTFDPKKCLRRHQSRSGEVALPDGGWMGDEDFEVEDPSGLTDADWAEINRLKRTLEEGGQKALSEAMR
jgi:hypothetical protein